jgi:hypothetical protein
VFLLPLGTVVGGGGAGVLLGTWVIVKGTDTAHTPGGWGNSGKIASRR